MAEIKWTTLAKEMPREQKSPLGWGISERVLVTFEDPEVFYGMKKRDPNTKSRLVATVQFQEGMVITVTSASLGIPIAWAEMPEPYTEDIDDG